MPYHRHRCEAGVRTADRGIDDQRRDRVVHGEGDGRFGGVAGAVVGPDVDGVDRVGQPGERVGLDHGHPGPGSGIELVLVSGQSGGLVAAAPVDGDGGYIGDVTGSSVNRSAPRARPCPR